jgi:hypothetical protein
VIRAASGRTGDRMTASIGTDGVYMGSEAVASYERVRLAPAVAGGQAVTMLRSRPRQPSRRAVLYVQAPGDPAVPAGLAVWYAERAFNFFFTQVRLPGGRAHRYLPALADLDAAVAYLREVECMHDVIVTACGAGALAAAVWSDARQRTADALILHAPAFPRRGVALNIDCPVLVVCPPQAQSAGRLRRPGRRVPPVQLGGHVTWRQLRQTTGCSSPAGDAGLHPLLAELGRWLGAYMYGQLGGQLL